MTDRIWRQRNGEPFERWLDVTELYAHDRQRLQEDVHSAWASGLYWGLLIGFVVGVAIGIWLS